MQLGLLRLLALGLRKLEPLKFEPELALEAPLLLWLLVELQKQLQLVLVLALEPQVVGLLRQEQARKLELLEFEPSLRPGLGLQR